MNKFKNHGIEQGLTGIQYMILDHPWCLDKKTQTNILIYTSQQIRVFVGGGGGGRGGERMQWVLISSLKVYGFDF